MIFWETKKEYVNKEKLFFLQSFAQKMLSKYSDKFGSVNVQMAALAQLKPVQGQWCSFRKISGRVDNSVSSIRLSATSRVVHLLVSY